jgi:hypothetical protein
VCNLSTFTKGEVKKILPRIILSSVSKLLCLLHIKLVVVQEISGHAIDNVIVVLSIKGASLNMPGKNGKLAHGLTMPRAAIDRSGQAGDLPGLLLQAGNISLLSLATKANTSLLKPLPSIINYSKISRGDRLRPRHLENWLPTKIDPSSSPARPLKRSVGEGGNFSFQPRGYLTPQQVKACNNTGSAAYLSNFAQGLSLTD